MSSTDPNKRCRWYAAIDADNVPWYECLDCGTRRKAKVNRICRSEFAQRRELTANREKLRRRRQFRRDAKREADDLELARQVRAARTWRARVPRYLAAITKWAVASVIAGRPLVREEAEYLRVRAICEACPSGQWDQEKEACRICGCGGRSKVVLANKLRLETEACPNGHW